MVVATKQEEMKKRHIEVIPSTLYIPKKVSEEVCHEIYINNRSPDHFLCVNVIIVSSTTFRIHPSSTMSLCPLSSLRVLLVKVAGRKPMGDESFHFMSKFVKNIFQLGDLGWNAFGGRLFDVKLRTSSSPPKKTMENFLLGEEGVGDEKQFVLRLKKEKRGVLLPMRDFSKVTVDYGLSPGEKSEEGSIGETGTTKQKKFRKNVNKSQLEDLYYDTQTKQLIHKDSTMMQIIKVYCPSCSKSPEKLALQNEKYPLVGSNNCRCSKCSECPICNCNLISTRDKIRGTYYLFCYNCNWTSTSIKHKIACQTQLEISKTLLEKEKVVNSSKTKNFNQVFQKYKRMSESKKKAVKKKRQKVDLRDVFIAAVKKTTETNTISVSNLIKNPDPLTKLFAEKTFKPEKIISAERRLLTPGYFSIIKRDLLPIRKRLLSKKVRKFDGRTIVKPYSQSSDIVNSVDFVPNMNASLLLPTAKVFFFERLVLNRESLVLLRFCNPTTSLMKVKLYQYKKKTKTIDTILNLPPIEFRILGRNSDEKEQKKLVEKEKSADEKTGAKSFFIHRKGNSILLKIGATPKNDRVKIVKFAMKATVTFLVSGKSHSVDMIIKLSLGHLEKEE